MQDKLEVTVDGKSRDLLMSFGLVNALSIIVGGPERVPMMSLDAEVRTEVLKAALADRKPSGKIITEVKDIGDLDIAMPEIEKILDWVSEHVMHFFVRSVQRAVNVTKKHETVLTALASSLNGSAGSPSATA